MIIIFEGSNSESSPQVVLPLEFIPKQPVQDLNAKFYTFPRDYPEDIKGIIQWPENKFVVFGILSNGETQPPIPFVFPTMPVCFILLKINP